MAVTQGEGATKTAVQGALACWYSYVATVKAVTIMACNQMRGWAMLERGKNYEELNIAHLC